MTKSRVESEESRVDSTRQRRAGLALDSLSNIYRLGVKELKSLWADKVLLLLIVWAFTGGVYSAAKGVSQEVRNAPIAIVDEDHSPLSRRIADAFTPPFFKPVAQIAFPAMDRALDQGDYSFVLVIPANFQRDLAAGRHPSMQVNIDATVMSQAFIGAGYIQNIVIGECVEYLSGRRNSTKVAQRLTTLPSPISGEGRGGEGVPAGLAYSTTAMPLGSPPPVRLVTRVRFNPNLTGFWFGGVMETVNNVNMLTIILVGAAFIREREHGTLEHLLVMPIRPFEIMLAKVWANGLAVLIGATFALTVMVEQVMQVPIAGSLPLFLCGAALYLFSAASIGIFLGTLARSMPQFGLLVLLTIIPLQLLSGGVTPRESMPQIVQNIMAFTPITYFVRLAQGVLYRGAGLPVVWPDFLAMAAIGAVFFVAALLRFRRAVTQTQL